MYENDERYQLDATILHIIINISTCFGHLQGDSRLVDITAARDFLGVCDKKKLI